MKFSDCVVVALCSVLQLVASQEPIYDTDVTAMNYTDTIDSGVIELQGYISIPEKLTMPAPAVVILPDADGVNYYEQMRATMLAKELGYVGFAADIYGTDLQNVTDRAQRTELLGIYRGNATLYTQRIQAAVDFVKIQPEVDPEKVAIIGYCFGGTGVLQYGLVGKEGVVGLVSFHGGLTNLPEDGPGVNPKLLVLSGGEDDTATAITDLENTLNNNSATWEITRYSGVQHAFTNFLDDRYNEVADSRSWLSMGSFLAEVFGEEEFMGMEPDSFDVETVDYNDTDSAMLRGYLSIPSADTFVGPYPAVVILPDWDGVNSYEKKRATLLAEQGYVGFAADIYGKDLQEDLDFPARIANSNLYRTDTELFIQRITAAVNLVKAHPMVDMNNIAIIGYCFGGTGVIEYAFSGMAGIKAVVSLHGGLTELPPPGPAIQSYVLVLSGGIDDAHGNQTILEDSLNEANATWEITRYANVDHAFTVWNGTGYNLLADTRSFESMMSLIVADMPPLLVSSNASKAPVAPSTFAVTTAAPATGAPTLTSSSGSASPFNVAAMVVVASVFVVTSMAN